AGAASGGTFSFKRCQIFDASCVSQSSVRSVPPPANTPSVSLKKHIDVPAQPGSPFVVFQLLPPSCVANRWAPGGVRPGDSCKFTQPCSSSRKKTSAPPSKSSACLFHGSLIGEDDQVAPASLVEASRNCCSPLSFA